VEKRVIEVEQESIRSDNSKVYNQMANNPDSFFVKR